MKRLLLYLLRWQLSTPILAFFTWWLSSYGSIWSSIIANGVGGLLFFWVDKLIFKSDHYEVWQVKEGGTCDYCGNMDSGNLWRLVRAPRYNRMESVPVFLCMDCSKKKTNELREQGIPVKGRSK